MTNTIRSKQITKLFFQQGSSDKVYEVSIEPIENVFDVYTTYGRRNQALKKIKKTNSPVSLIKAKAMHDKLVKSKKAKGYQESGSASASYTSDNSSKPHSGIYPQLLTEIDLNKSHELCRNPLFCAQEKHDGERRMLYCNDNIKGINKKGIFVPINNNFCENVNLKNSILDGEDMGNHIVIFDALELNGKDIRKLSFESRYQALKDTLYVNNTIRLSKVAFTEKEKLDLLVSTRKNSGEGLVFKDINAPYTPGRDEKTQFKYKFYCTASVIIQGHNEGKRSVRMSVIDDKGRSISIGSVTIPVNKPIPQIGSVAEVRYMYFFDNGCLFQPVFLFERTDVDANECRRSLLKVKKSAV